MFLRVMIYLDDLGLCDIMSKDTTHSHAPRVYLEHNPRCSLPVQGKENFQDVHYELHGRVVVIDQDNLVQGGRFNLGLASSIARSSL